MTPFELSQLSPAEALLWNYGISDPADIDFFCTPRVRARLEAALAQIDARRIDKGAAA